MPGRGPAGQVSWKCFWHQRSRTKSRVAKFKNIKQLLVEQIRWYGGFAIFLFALFIFLFIHFLEMLVYSRVFPIPWKTPVVSASSQNSKKKTLLIDTIVRYQYQYRYSMFSQNIIHISVVYVCRQQFCEISNCIAVKFVTHVLEKSRWGMCGEKNPSHSTKCHGVILCLSTCNKHTASRAAAPADGDSAHSLPEWRLVHSDPLAGELLRNAGSHNG